MKDVARDEIVEIIDSLVRFQTIANRWDQIRQACQWIKQYLADADLNIREYEIDSLPVMVITTQNTKTPGVMFQAHLDVVPGTDEQFQPKVVDGRLIGRGTADMKGFVAVALHLIRDMARSEEPCDIGLMLTCDEETSGAGAAFLAREGFSGKVILNGDGGYSGSVTFAEKGVLEFQVDRQVIPARRAYPWEGKSALKEILSDYKRIQAFFPNESQAIESDNWHSTCSLLDIQSKHKDSYLPHFAQMHLRAFFIEDCSPEELLGKIRDELPGAQVELIRKADRVYLNPDDPHVTLFRDLLASHLGCDVQLKAENGTSDARFFANRGVPIVITRVLGGDFHSSDEYIDIESLAPFEKGHQDH